MIFRDEFFTFFLFVVEKKEEEETPIYIFIFQIETESLNEHNLVNNPPFGLSMREKEKKVITNNNHKRICLKKKTIGAAKLQ